MSVDVPRIHHQTAVELFQRFFRLTQQRQAQPPQMVDIGEPPSRLENLIEEVNGPVVVLNGEPLVGLLEEMFGADSHGRLVADSERSPSRRDTPRR